MFAKLILSAYIFLIINGWFEIQDRINRPVYPSSLVMILFLSFWIWWIQSNDAESTRCSKASI